MTGLTPISGAEVDLELPRRSPRLGEVVDRDHAADPHVDRLELLPADARAAVMGVRTIFSASRRS